MNQSKQKPRQQRSSYPGNDDDLNRGGPEIRDKMKEAQDKNDKLRKKSNTETPEQTKQKIHKSKVQLNNMKLTSSKLPLQALLLSLFPFNTQT